MSVFGSRIYGFRIYNIIDPFFEGLEGLRRVQQIYENLKVAQVASHFIGITEDLTRMEFELMSYLEPGGTVLGYIEGKFDINEEMLIPFSPNRLPHKWATLYMLALKDAFLLKVCCEDTINSPIAEGLEAQEENIEMLQLISDLAATGESAEDINSEVSQKYFEMKERADIGQQKPTAAVESSHLEKGKKGDGDDSASEEQEEEEEKKKKKKKVLCVD
eukprot:Platyproteum_vivax@DN14400_c0_g1_i1.p1